MVRYTMSKLVAASYLPTYSNPSLRKYPNINQCPSASFKPEVFPNLSTSLNQIRSKSFSAGFERHY